MKKLSIAITLLLCVVSVPLLAQNKSDAIIGIWSTGDKDIEVVKTNNKYIGNPVNADGTKNTAAKVLDLVYKDGKWVGKIHSKERKRYYEVECEVKGSELLLEISAGFMTKNLEWTRIK